MNWAGKARCLSLGHDVLIGYNPSPAGAVRARFRYVTLRYVTLRYVSFRSDPTRSDPTRPDPTRPDPTHLLSSPLLSSRSLVQLRLLCASIPSSRTFRIHVMSDEKTSASLLFSSFASPPPPPAAASTQVGGLRVRIRGGWRRQPRERLFPDGIHSFTHPFLNGNEASSVELS